MGADIMSKFISDAEMAELEKQEPQEPTEGKSFISDAEMAEHDKSEMQSHFNISDQPIEKMEHPKSWMELVKQFDAKPMGEGKNHFAGAFDDPTNVGMMLGGAAGSALPGVGTIPGAAIGGYMGKASQNLYNRFKNPEEAPQTNSEYITQPIEAGAESAFAQAVGDKVFHGISPVAQAIKNSLKDKAERLAFRGLGPFKRQVNQNKDRIHEIGRTALDKGVIKFPPGSAETVEKRAKEASDIAGKNLGEIVDEILKLEKQTKGRFSTGSVKRLGDYLRQELIVPNTKVPGIQKQNAAFEAMIKELTDNNKRLNFEQMRKMKIDTNGMINWDRLKGHDVPDQERFYRALYKGLRKGEEYGAEALETAWHGKPSKRFVDAKKTYGNLEEAGDIAGNRADAQRANQILGLKSSIYGAAGAAAGSSIGHDRAGKKGAIIGGIIGGGAGAIGNHLAKNYGSQFSAVILDQAAKIISKSPNLLNTSQKFPNFIPFLLKSLAEKEEKEEK
jgi:hypothetical protein